ncbi:MAG: hypothetical protein SFW67_07160 [Myxococcaceae bacterium]|nr:hypothetical protein [Myxococcaceae bacterium]
MLGLALVLTLAQTPAPDAPPLPPPPLVDAATPESPPPPSTAFGTRSARLLDNEYTPSTPTQLVGRAVLAPVIGAASAGVFGFLGLLGGGVLGLIVAGTGTSGLVIAAAVGLLVGAVTGFLGLGLGLAVGAALFSENFGRLFRRSIGWAFAAAGIATALAIIVAIAFPLVPLAGSLSLLIGGAALGAAVPLIVESRRLAEAPPAPEASLTLARF